MKTKLRHLSLIMALILALSLLGGCGGGSTPESSKPVTSAEASVSTEPTSPVEDTSAPSENPSGNVSIAYPLTEETVTLTYFQQLETGLASDLTPSYNDNKALQYAEAQTGVALDCMDVARDSYQEKLNIMLASNDLTDLIYGMRLFYPKSLSGAIEEELIVDLAPYWQEWAPDYYNTVVENDFMRDILSDDGTVGQFNSLEPDIYNPGLTGPFVRKDWLDDLGLDIPETIDDIYNMLVLFRDEKGASDAFFTGGTLSKGINACYDLTYLGASQEGTLEFFQKDGVVTIAALEPGFKECVELYRNWFAEGLIYKDFAIMPPWGGEDIMASYIVEDKSGFYFGDAMGVTIDTWKEESGDPDFEIVSFANPVKESGGMNKVSLNGLWAVDANGTSITTACKDLELAINYINWWYTEEGSLTKSFGILGESYEFDADGEPYLTDLIINNPDGYSSMQMQYNYCLMQQFGNTDPRKTTSTYNESMLTWPDLWSSTTTGEISYPRFVTLTNDETEQIATKATDIATILSEVILAVIVGERPLEDIDSMIAQIKSLGIDEILQVQQTAYDRYIARG